MSHFKCTRSAQHCEADNQKAAALAAWREAWGVANDHPDPIEANVHAAVNVPQHVLGTMAGPICPCSDSSLVACTHYDEQCFIEPSLKGERGPAVLAGGGPPMFDCATTFQLLVMVLDEPALSCLHTRIANITAVMTFKDSSIDLIANT